MKLNGCWVCLLLFEIVTSSPLADFTQHEAASNLQHPATHSLARSRRQTEAGSILGDIFQIPIQTLTAVSQLFNSAKKQRDKRRPYQNYLGGDNDGGYSTYNNGQSAAPFNGNNNYNNNFNNANNNKFNGAQTAYNNGYNAYSNANKRPSYNNYNNGNNNIGANAFSKPSSGNNNNNMFNRPFHYLSQYMSGNNRVSRTHGAIISELSEAADGSGFKI